MRLALIGSTGRIGRHLEAEASLRGHAVTRLRRGELDIFDRPALARALRGHEALVSAYGVPADEPLDLLPRLARVLVDAARLAGGVRIVTIGGAGMLEVAPGMRLGDSPEFPDALKPKVVAHAAAVDALRSAADQAWTCVVPAAQIGPGMRTGRYRLRVGELVRRADGRSTIAYPDFACAVLDELESGRHPQAVLGVGD
jgi:uncharacterized protein